MTIPQLKEKLLICAADNKQFKAQILELAEAFDTILSEYEIQLFRQQVALRKQLAEERKLLDILETYGIDLQQSLARSDLNIASDHDLAKTCDVFKVPEKFTNIIKIQI